MTGRALPPKWDMTDAPPRGRGLSEHPDVGRGRMWSVEVPEIGMGL